MKPPRPKPLRQYRREGRPDLEVEPREPVHAVGLVSPKGVPFVLVREQVGSDSYGSMLAWLLWRGDACVGYVGTTFPAGDPFADACHANSWAGLDVRRAVYIWRCHVVDGTGRGTGAQVLARIPSRGLGLAFTSYVEIITQLSAHGWALSSNPKARSADAKRLWERLRDSPEVEILRSKKRDGVVRDYAFTSTRRR